MIHLCPCSCCKDAAARAVTGRSPKQGCDCMAYKEDERCDCTFCREVIGESEAVPATVPGPA